MFPKKGNKLHLPESDRQVGTSFSRAIATALHMEVGSTHQAVKITMRWTGASERTAKHWLAGTHGPSGEYLIELLRNSDAVFRAVLTLSGRKKTISDASLVRLREQLMVVVECLGRDQ